MEEQDKDMKEMKQEINNLSEQVAKILELISAEKKKGVAENAKSSSLEETNDPTYPPGFTPGIYVFSSNLLSNMLA